MCRYRSPDKTTHILSSTLSRTIMANTNQTLRLFGEAGSISLSIASAILICSSFSDISTRSEGSYSWGDESSLMALQMRSIGFQKLGLGVAIGTLASARIKLDNSVVSNQKEPVKAPTKDDSLIRGKRWDGKTQTWVNPS